MQIVTCFSFRANGYVNYSFPAFARSMLFVPRHAVKPAGGDWIGFAHATKEDAERCATMTPDEFADANPVAAIPRKWAKFPQIFEKDMGRFERE
jgi:hypothetical protein